MKIWLDDKRDAPDDSWIILRTGNALAGMLMAHDGDVEEVSFDHDLGHFEYDPERGETIELTGYTWLCQIEHDVAQGLIKHPPKLSVHSANAGIYIKMMQTIESIERMSQDGDV